MSAVTRCPRCGAPTAALPGPVAVPAAVSRRLLAGRPDWRPEQGACPACLARATLACLRRPGPIEGAGTLDPGGDGAPFAALPTPARLRADTRFTGRGVTLAQVDAGFFPHPDLALPRNRLRAWFDAARPERGERWFDPGEAPEWPGWEARDAAQWHGLMTTGVMAGNGLAGGGLYRGLASGADLALVQVLDDEGRIRNETIARGLRWLLARREALGLAVVNLSVGGDPVMPLRGNAVDQAVADLVEAGVVVVAAAGNEGARRLVPPATAPEAITVGGLDDRNNFDPADLALWHGNFGLGTGGSSKPELVAPSLWVAAPLLPGTAVAREAAQLFARLAAGDPTAGPRLAELRLVTAHYQHVEGTSFSAPILASLVAVLLEISPGLGPAAVRALLLAAAEPVPGAAPERQGAGAVDAAQAIARALRGPGGPLAGRPPPPEPLAEAWRFWLSDPWARTVRLFGSWNGWAWPGHRLSRDPTGLWRATLPAPAAGCHQYRFLVDGWRWLDDPANPRKTPDGLGGFNSLAVWAGSAPAT